MLYNNFVNNLQTLLVDLSLSTHLAIAVSGGSDSIALLIMMDRWSKDNNVKLSMLTVDHNLRDQSKFEVEYVKELSVNLGHECIVLAWDHEKNFANLQERAREGRYKLMTDFCNNHNIYTLLTAHHQDDYIENFHIRSERKSGILGLSSSAVNYCNDIRILRPLFNIEKQDLVNYLLDNEIKWFEDESNNSIKYQRNRVRQTIAKYDEVYKEKILSEQVRVNDEALIIKNDLIKAIAESVAIYQYGFAKVNLQILNEFSTEIKLHLLSFVLNMISGKSKVPRSESTLLIVSIIERAENFTKTLHGCVVKKIGCNLLIYRELGKHPPKNVPLQKDTKWDNRFYIENSIEELVNTYVGNLNINEYKEIKDQLDLKELEYLSFSNHREILFTLPAIKRLEKIIALPHISFYTEQCLKDICFSYQPNFVSRFTHFS